MSDAAEVLGEPIPPGMIAMAAVVIAEVIDPKTGEPLLHVHRDTDRGIWTHIGMVRVALDDLLADCRVEDQDDDG